MAESLFSNSYSYAMDIDERFRRDFNFSIKIEDFRKLTNVLQYPVTHTGQKKYFDFFYTLPPEDLIPRISAVSSLVNILKNIKKNSE